MNWEETIIHIRQLEEYQDLVENTYISSDLVVNVERFRQSTEYQKTLKIIEQDSPQGNKLLDIGCGNGISAISFALDGYDVVALEPDPSLTVGAGAIRTLKEHYQLSNITVVESYAETLPAENETFDIVYARQAMHHAHNLQQFLNEGSRVLKKNGLLLTVRDHVVFNAKDKALFLEYHPLQKFYGGENAFTPKEYKTAFANAGLNIKQELKYFDSIINYFPSSIEKIKANGEQQRRNSLVNKLGGVAKNGIVQWLYNTYLNIKVGRVLSEKNIPGRMYTYISTKI